ncbi:ATP-dependent DNA helicase [Lactobacillus selangorensis]|uniref:ATP-dependent DNA helicase n=1 Tax=Lactobacillus selangorensis TaxID=81857 RepID=A0A0R2FZ94_9LACO|nr:RNA polymerase recycling motor HelD [Lactobacillus selangorensis]KRN27941.1 ATP-dependent DNA helicase [Lactobacillus selangorensis]KRN30588.1 ATP-dependent DNA helicase [Lactobacillus selangorensis]
MTEKNERQKEQQRVDHVVAQIKKRQVDLNDQLAKAHHETRAIEQNYGDNTRVNTTEVDDRMETNAAVQQQKQMVANSVENETILKTQTQRLDELENSPYFGRVDIKEDGEQETLYIGTSTFIDDENHFLIYDWRAPISSIYYNGTLGQVSYDTPTGPTTVALEKKRQFLIQHGQIENMFDTNETVGDEILQQILGGESSEYMQNIVATIQKEQNDIIRDTSADVLIVQGAAGSGKTSAILQRIAYLLYHSRSHLNAEQMILFSPNRLFSNYISEVLPSLGEKNMRQVTLDEFFRQRFSGLKVESRFERFERDQRHFPKTARLIRRSKESVAFMEAVRSYAKSTALRKPAFSSIYFEGAVFFSKDEITAIYQGLPERMLPADKFIQTKNTLIRRLKQIIREQTDDDDVQDEVDLLSSEDYERLLNGHEFESAAHERHYLGRKLLYERYEPIYAAIYNDYFFDLYQEYDHFLATQSVAGVSQQAWDAMRSGFRDLINKHRLDLDDAAPLLYLRDVLTGGGQNHAIQFLFIDEMQDYSLAQLHYVHHAFPKAKLTLLGDRQQDVFGAHDAQTDFMAAIASVFPHKRVRLINLNKSYRSTQEITDFAKALLPDGDAIQSFTRPGAKPVVLDCPNDDKIVLTELTRTVYQALDQHHTVAILTKTQAAAEQLFARLTLDTPIHLLSAANRSIPEGVIILPIYLAKGLEFDTVIGYDISAGTYGTQDADLLYTLATRAMHLLTLIAIGTPSPLLTDLPADLDTLKVIE